MRDPHRFCKPVGPVIAVLLLLYKDSMRATARGRVGGENLKQGFDMLICHALRNLADVKRRLLLDLGRRSPTPCGTPSCVCVRVRLLSVCLRARSRNLRTY